MLDADHCWQAVCDRNATQDGRFVFAVHSTGIYCRPSCPARRPRRENVSFHLDADAAAAAGFRPCKRCSPQGQSPAEQLDALVVAACELLDNSEQPLPLAQLAARIGLSASHLARAFKARTGLTPKAWSEVQRRARLEQQLPAAHSVLDAALNAGYSGTRALYQQPASLSPAQRRKQAAGERLRYSIAPCPLGHLLLASSAKASVALTHQLIGRLQSAQSRSDLARPVAMTLMQMRPAKLPAAAISVSAVIAAVDESVDATRCQGKSDCHGGARCLTHTLWSNLSHRIEDFLTNISLEELVNQEEVRQTALQQSRKVKNPATDIEVSCQL